MNKFTSIIKAQGGDGLVNEHKGDMHLPLMAIRFLVVAGQSYALNSLTGKQGLQNTFVNKHVANAVIYSVTDMYVINRVIRASPEPLRAYVKQIAQASAYVIADYILNKKINLMGALNNVVATYTIPLVEPKALEFIKKYK